MLRVKNRRGVTLVLMAFMLTVLIGAAAFAVDFGRMMLYRTQLSAASDAAALAGAWHVLHKNLLPDSAVAAAQDYASRHRVGPDAVQVDASEVSLGHWTIPTAGGCTPKPPGPGITNSCWQSPASDTNGVMVVSRTRTSATQSYTFGKVLGFDSHTVRDTAIAVMGYVGVTTCVRPIALPLQSLLVQLYDTNADGTPKVTVADHPTLVDSDVVRLRNAGIADTVSLKLGSSADQGNFYIVQLGPYAHADGVPLSPSPDWNTGANPFGERFGGDCSHSPWSIGPGDWLQGKTGDADGPTRDGYGTLCGVSSVGNGATPCVPPDSIKIAVWGREDDTMCSPRCFQVAFVGIFVVVDFLKTSGANAFEGVVGYFAAMPSSGSFTNVPTPIQKIGLVY